MHSSFASRCITAIAAAALFTAACSDSPSGPKHGAPTEIEVVLGEDQVGPAGAQLANPVVVLVLDAEGRPVPNQAMTFVVMAGGGSVQDATPRTDEDGYAGARWTLGPSMHTEQRLEARAVSGSGSTIASVSILATPGPGAPATLVVIPPGTDGSVYPGVRVVDQYGNAVQGVTVTFEVIAGGGTLEGATQLSNALGIATVGRWNLGAPGANTLRASSGTLTPVTYTINQQSRVPAEVVLSAGQNQTAMVGSNVPVPPSVIVKNDVGTPLADIVVTFTPGTNSGSPSSPTVTTGANGMATLSGWTLGPVVGTQTLVAYASPTVSFTFTATATPARVGRLEKNSGDAQVALVNTAVTTPPSVKVLDVYGNPVPGVAVTFSVYNGLGTITGANAVSNASGIATVGSWTLGPFAGTQTLRASAEGASDLDITATATTGQAALITAHPDNSMSALMGAEINLAVIVVDDLGNPKAGVPVSFAPRTSPHFGQGSVIEPSQNVMTNGEGVASVRYVMPTHPYANGGVHASSPGLPPLEIGVTPETGPPAEIRVIQPTGTVVAGSDIGQLMFGVFDAYGNAIPFHPVTFAVTAGNGTVDGAAQTTVHTGAPGTPMTLGPVWKSGPVAGTNTIVLSSDNLPNKTVSIVTVSPP